MRTSKTRIPWRRLALLTTGGTFILSGCDPQIVTTVENGLISLSTSMLGSLMTVLVDLVGEAQDATACILPGLTAVIG